jgi:hypothetical protein
MISAPVIIHIGPIQFIAGDFLTECDSFQHRTVTVSATAHVIDFAGARIPEKSVKRPHKVGAVYVVANLLAFVSEHLIGGAGGRAFEQVCEKAVELRTRVIGPR